MMLKTLSRHNAILVLFAVACTSMLVLIQSLTEPRIQQQVVIQQRALLEQVLQSTAYDNDLLRTCYQVQHPMLGSVKPQRLYVAYHQGIPVARVITSEAAGYAGPIQLLIGSNAQGKILGVRVIAHQETPGLGDKIEIQRASWIQMFIGRERLAAAPRWEVRKAGGDFDQLSGATITSRAVIHQVWHTLHYLADLSADYLQQPHCVEAP